MTKIKVCGITSLEDALLAVEAGADFLGYVLSDSPRRVGYETLAEIVNVVGERAHSVGVFANEQDLRQFVHLSKVRLDYYQVYFEVDKTQRPLPRHGWIEAIWVNDDQIRIAPSNGLLLADFKKADSKVMERMLVEIDSVLQEKIIIAGNLSVENVGEIVRRYRPFAVDVARGTESKPGIKDAQLVRDFINEVKHAAA